MRDLLELYGASREQRERLLRLAQEARQKKAWWRAYGDVPDVRTLIAYEESAAAISVYESLVIPGLLQVEEYTRLLLRAIFPNLSHQKIERMVELRMRRQSLLVANDPPLLEVVLNEAAIHCLVSDRQVMQRQLRRLIEAVGMSNVVFQLLAFKVGPHDGMVGPFTILSFADPADQAIVHLEHSTGEIYLHRADQVERYRAKFEHLQELACAPGESTAALLDLVGQL